MKYELCYYCGMPAESTDHVIPLSVLRNIRGLPMEQVAEITRNRILTVESCHECNHLLGATVQESLRDRKKYLKERLKKRYAKILIVPDWTEEELMGLGPHLRATVLSGIAHRNRVRIRLSY